MLRFFKDSKERLSPRVKRIAWMVMGAALLIVVVTMGVKHLGDARETRERKKQIAAGPTVQVIPVRASGAVRHLVLVGEARPYESVTLYAKVSGYLKTVNVDKGDAVEKGQLLAVIASPESTQDFEGANADAVNKAKIAERLKPLLEQRLISQQEADAAFSDADMATARRNSLAAVKGYQDIRAPFTGTITSRFSDPGTLIQSGSAPLFTLSKLNRLRVYAYVNQSDAPSIRRGVPVKITLDERPDIQIAASITRFSGELDPRTRMLLAEVELDNKDNTLVAGSFVKVAMDVQSASYPQIPTEALVLREAKEFVVVVSSAQTISYRPVVIADNDGEHIRLLSGVELGEKVALNLGNSLDEGAHVKPIDAPLPAGATPQTAGGSVAPSTSTANAPQISTAAATLAKT